MIRTNAPGTCLWCGKRVPKSRRFHYDDYTWTGGAPGVGVARKHYTEPVTNGSEHFHTNECAARFGCVFAREGKRLKPFSDEIPPPKKAEGA